MSDLKKELRKQGFDYIDGPIRNQLLLSIWEKRDTTKVYWFQMLDKFFVSSIILEKPDPITALYVNYSKTVNYGFEAGFNALEDILKKANMGNLGLGMKIKGGKDVSISYNNAKTIDYLPGDLDIFFGNADANFKNPSSEVLKQANQDHFIIIAGVLLAQNLEVRVKTTSDIDINLAAELTKIVNGKIEFTREGSKELIMKSDIGSDVPIAVKAYRLEFKGGKYKRMSPITDHREWF
jgi:hypothetical protein